MSNQTTVASVRDTSTFQRRSPKGDCAAVKLTAKNIQEVAGHILEVMGGPVTVGRPDNTMQMGQLPVDGRLAIEFVVGDWLVKEYDYERDVDVFRLATLDERKKYDLR